MAVHLNIMALDVGERRIGLAIASSASRLSSPFKTIVNSDSVLVELGEIISQESINLLVVGLPRSLEGNNTSQTDFSRVFADKLKVSVDIPVYLEDEALSSVRAKNTLEDRGQDYKKEDIDSLAACYILDDFMNHHKEVINV